MRKGGIFVKCLEQTPVFAACSRDELERVAALALPRQIAAGADIVREGDDGDELYLIASGSAVVSRAGHEVARLGDGDIFGELAVLDPAPRDATVTATSTVLAAVLGHDAFRRSLDEIPSLRDQLMVGMARRIRELDRRP